MSHTVDDTIKHGPHRSESTYPGDMKAEQPEWSKELDRLRAENERLRQLAESARDHFTREAQAHAETKAALATARKDALEEAAKLCDSLTEYYKRKKTYGAGGQQVGLYEADASECRDTIRALAQKEE